MIVTRFAPSPTGYLHVGNLRNALFSYLVAKKNSGKFLLRIEDTDQERFVQDSLVRTLKVLYQVGIVPDEGVKLLEDSTGNYIINQEGSEKSYIQSERLDTYKKYIKLLIDKEYAYYCFCTKDRLDEIRKSKKLIKISPGYDKQCRKINLVEAKKRVEEGELYTIRLKMPESGETIFEDMVRGKISFKNILVDDQILIKSDGFPTYHFAMVVDDHLMKVSHVIRSEEWLSSTPKHLQLYKYFGWKPPEFAHPPLLLNPDRSKLSKRQGDVAVEDFINKGYLPEAIINFIAFLGWNPGGEKELFTLEELCDEFDISRINKSGAIFNIEKLNWYNQQYIKKMDSHDLIKSAKRWLNKEGLYAEVDKIKLGKAVELEKERIEVLSELPDAISFFFNLPKYDADILVWKKSTKKETLEVLSEMTMIIKNIKEGVWSENTVENAIRTFILDKKYDNGSVLWPLRVSLSGRKNSPGPFAIAEVLGSEETLFRIEQAVSVLDNKSV